MVTFTWKRSLSIETTSGDPYETRPDPQLVALKDRFWSFCERLAKGVLAVALYGSGTLVLSGVLFYFSWKLGLIAFLVLSGLLPLAGSAYLLWRLMGRGRPGLWRASRREAAILGVAKRLGGRLTVADVALGTGLTLHASERALNALVRRGYAELQVSADGVLIYHCFPVVDAQRQAERALS